MGRSCVVSSLEKAPLPLSFCRQRRIWAAASASEGLAWAEYLAPESVDVIKTACAFFRSFSVVSPQQEAVVVKETSYLLAFFSPSSKVSLKIEEEEGRMAMERETTKECTRFYSR